MSGLAKEIKKVKALVDLGKFEEAFSSCETLFREFPDMRSDLLRLRAYAFSVQGQYELAIVDRTSLIASGDALLRDYYQVADNSISAGRFADASNWFREVIRLGKEQNEKWFESAALLLLSFAELQLGRLQEATHYLDQAEAIDPECTMPVRGHGRISPERMRKEIALRYGRES